ncbi:hypothetical protein EB118_19925 [bacterium]|nr:hypothetical protein [Chitinophagia bacterium]NDC95767.1 hypothetical protein [bacterium]NDD85414.1 hypothetical protein [bacterium]NDG32331.1 hypothetical protein [bacterium]
MTIACLDAFSGIGGVSLALRGIAETKLYCEWNAFCQSVLVEQMKRGVLDRAPIHSDINTLYLPEDTSIEMITAGYPCQDISSMGLQKGIVHGTRSGLFYQVVRLLGESASIRVIFLENVSNILNVGLHEVIKALVELNFNFAWTMRSAGEFGAPHQRKRWFLLGVRDGFDLSTLGTPSDDTDTAFIKDWSNEPERRFDYKKDADRLWSQRCGALGNSVCPKAVRSAFIELRDILSGAGVYTKMFKTHGRPATQLTDLFQSTGLVYEGVYYPLPLNTLVGSNEGTVKITLNINGTHQILQRFPTPRNGITHASALTARSIRDLPTVLVQCEETRAQLIRSSTEKIIPSVNYIEWMMGYPKDYTHVPGPKCTKLKPESTCIEESRSKPRSGFKYNGMHAFMKTISGKRDIQSVAKRWNELTEQQKNHFRDIAKTM